MEAPLNDRDDGRPRRGMLPEERLMIEQALLAIKEGQEKLERVVLHEFAGGPGAAPRTVINEKRIDKMEQSKWGAALAGLKEALGSRWYMALIVGVLIVLGMAVWKSDDPLGDFFELFRRAPVEVDATITVPPDSTK